MTHAGEHEPRGVRIRLVQALIAFAAAGLAGFAGFSTLRSPPTADATTYAAPADGRGRRSAATTRVPGTRNRESRPATRCRKSGSREQRIAVREVLLSIRRQPDLERRASLGRVGGRHRSAVPLDDRPDDREAESAAGRHSGAGARRVHLVEAIEDARQVLGRNARAGVAHGDADAGRRRAAWQRDPSAVRRVTDGVRREVLQRLLEAFGVAADVGRARSDRRGPA